MKVENIFGLGKKGPEAPLAQNNEGKAQKSFLGKIGLFAHNKEVAQEVAPIAAATPEISAEGLPELNVEAPVNTPDIAAESNVQEQNTSVDTPSATPEIPTHEDAVNETAFPASEAAPLETIIDTDHEFAVSEAEAAAEITEPAESALEDVPEKAAKDTEEALKDFASTLDAVESTVEEAEAPATDTVSPELDAVAAPESAETIPAPQETQEAAPSSDIQLEIPNRPSLTLVAPGREEQPVSVAPTEPRGEVVVPKRESEDESNNQLAA